MRVAKRDSRRIQVPAVWSGEISAIDPVEETAKSMEAEESVRWAWPIPPANPVVDPTSQMEQGKEANFERGSD